MIKGFFWGGGQGRLRGGVGHRASDRRHSLLMNFLERFRLKKKEKRKRKSEVRTENREESEKQLTEVRSNVSTAAM